MAIPKFTAVKWGAGSMLRFLRKYYYWIIFAIIIMPIILATFQEASQQDNPSLPFIKLGLHLSNADAIIYDDVQTLKTNPALLIGSSKPDNGIWKNMVYYWGIVKLVWKFFGLIWLIAFPFVIFYKILRTRQTSEPAKNFLKTMIYGIIFIFVINLIVTIYSLVSGTIVYNLPTDASMETKTWLIILTTLPFHGVVSLFIFLFSSIK